MEKGKIYDTLETKTDYKECCRWIRTKYLLKIFQHFSGGLKAVLKTGSMICIARSLLTVNESPKSGNPGDFGLLSIEGGLCAEHAE